MKKTTLNAIAMFIAAAPLVFLSVVYSGLPQTVPVHFGVDMQPNRWGHKSEIWVPAIIVFVLSAAVYFLFQNLHKIDPKRSGPQLSPVFQKMGFGLLVFLALLNFLLVEMVKGDLNLTKVLLPLCGLLFAFIGNYLYNIKPNYFAGYRVPWTLHDEDNWRKTHRVGSKFWFAGGLLIAAVCPFLPTAAAFLFFLAVLSVMVCIPLVYSYRLFKQKQKTV